MEVPQVASRFWAEQPREGWRLSSLRWGHPLHCVSETVLFYHEGEREAGSELSRPLTQLAELGLQPRGSTRARCHHWAVLLRESLPILSRAGSGS